MTTLIDWTAVCADVTDDDLSTPPAELAVQLADLAVSYLPPNAAYEVDMDDIMAGIEAARL